MTRWDKMMRNTMTPLTTRAAVMLLATLLVTACGRNNEDNNTTPEDDMGSMTTPAEDMGGDTPDDGGETDMGEEPDPDMGEEPDPDMGEDPPDMNEDPDMMMPPTGPDVPEVEPNNELDPEEGIDESTSFEAGQSIGGNITASAAGAPGDLDIYSVELEAGTIFEWSFAEVGDGITDAGLASFLQDGTTGNTLRALYTADGTKRQAFIPADDTYYLFVYDAADEAETQAEIPAHGGPSATYLIENASIEPSAQALTAPGSASGDLNDGDVDVYSFQWMSEQVIAAQITGAREPISSDIDSVLYLWDADAGELIATNDDLSSDTLDSAVSAAGANGGNYLLIVDAYIFAPSSAYQLDVASADDSPDAPGTLTTMAPSTGVIGEADAMAEEYDTDYWAITLQPGETIKFTATADADLQPSLAIYLNDRGSFQELAFARPVDGKSAVTISVPTTLDAPIELYALVDDIRNLPTDEMDTPDYVGGANFGYTLTAADNPHTTNNIMSPATLNGTLDEVGEFIWFDFTTPAEAVLLIEASSMYADNTDTADLLLAQLDGNNGVAFSGSPMTYVNTVAGTKTFGVVDAAYQAGSLMATPYDYTFNLNVIDTSAVVYAPLADPMTNTSEATATTLTPPVAVSEQTQATDPMAPVFDYYKVDLTAGDTLIAITAEDPSAPPLDPMDPNSTPEFADTVMAIYDANGNELVRNDDLRGDVESTFSAVSYTATADGTYTIVVEPYFSAFFGDYSNGYYLLRVLVAQ